MARQRGKGSGPTNFIPAAAYSECITIPLSLFLFDIANVLCSYGSA